jgi:hypothetical protein
LLIDVVKASVVHAVKLAEDKSSLGNAKILASTFQKISKSKEKQSNTRFFVMTKEQFSYYMTEDHYNYSEDLAIMRFGYADVAEVAFKVGVIQQTKDDEGEAKYQLVIYLAKCVKDNQSLTQQILKLGFASYSRPS